MIDLKSSQERAEWLQAQANIGLQNAPVPYTPPRFRKIEPATKLKPLAAKLLAVSNALWQRPDSLRRVKGEI